MKQATLAFLGLSLLVLCGCMAPRSEFVPPTGALFTWIKAPLLIDCDQASVGDRSGKGSAHYIYDPILTGLSASLGDCSLKEAMRKGHFGRVGTADYEFLSILGIYSKTTVHAYQSTQPE